MKNRYEHIDAAKGIAMLLVLLGHVVHNTYAGQVIYSFHMPFFFIISGLFVKPAREIKLFPYLKKNARHLLLPYLEFALLGLLFAYLVPDWRSAVTPENIKSAFLKCNPYFWNTATPLWFLVAVFDVKIIYYLLDRLLPLKTAENKPHTGSYIIVVLIFALGMFRKSLPWKLNAKLFFQYDTAIVAVAFFLIGYLFRDEILSFRLEKNRTSVAVALFCLAITVSAPLINGSVNLGKRKYNNAFLYVLIALCGSYAVLALSSLLKKSRFLAFVGRETMTFLVVHNIVKAFYTLFIQRVAGIEIENTFNIHNIIRFAVMLVLSSLAAMLNRKLKNAVDKKRKPV